MLCRRRPSARHRVVQGRAAPRAAAYEAQGQGRDALPQDLQAVPGRRGKLHVRRNQCVRTDQGRVHQSCLSSQFAFHSCKFAELLNIQKNVPFRGRPNNISVVNYLFSVVNYLAKTVPASDAPSAIPAKTDCFGQMTSVSAENDSLLAETVAFRFEVLKSPR